MSSTGKIVIGRVFVGVGVLVDRMGVAGLASGSRGSVGP